MRRGLGATLLLAVIAAGCSGNGAAPTSPSTAQSTGSPGAGAPTQADNNAGVEVKGTVDALPPTTAALSFMTAGKTIVTNSSTVFLSGTTAKKFADLKLGMRVEVRGTASGSTITATTVELEDAAENPEPEPEPQPAPKPPAPNPPAPTPPAPNPPAPAPTPVPAELSGTIASLTGTASSFQFMIGNTQVKGDASTMITGSGDAPKTFADLKNGARVEVNGTQQTGFVHAVRVHIEDAENEPPDNNDNEAEVEGTLGSISGTCPSISSSVGTTKFTTTASTRFDDVACTALQAGSKVQVKGTRNADGSIAATRVKKD